MSNWIEPIDEAIKDIVKANSTPEGRKAFSRDGGREKAQEMRKTLQALVQRLHPYE